MKKLILAALALASVSIARADEFTISKVENIETLPCSIFSGEGIVSLREGVTLSIPLSGTNNRELFDRLGERSAHCRQGGSLSVLSDAAAQ